MSILDGAILVGEPAKERLPTHPRDTVAVFKRAMGTDKSFRLGRKNYSAVDLSAMVLSALRSLAEEELGTTVRDVVISVPAYFNQLQRDAVRNAALTADLNPVRLINEPTAAAIAYGLQDIEDQGHILVFDLGGGTFDVSIIEVFDGVLEVKAYTLDQTPALKLFGFPQLDLSSQAYAHVDLASHHLVHAGLADNRWPLRASPVHHDACEVITFLPDLVITDSDC